MIERELTPILLESASYYPVVTLTGPRQSGKTTLCRAAFPEHAYVSLEAFDTRSVVVYRGDAKRRQSDVLVLPWDRVDEGPWVV